MASKFAITGEGQVGEYLEKGVKQPESDSREVKKDLRWPSPDKKHPQQ